MSPAPPIFFVLRVNDAHPPGTPIVNDASLPNVSTVPAEGGDDEARDGITVTPTAGDPDPSNNITQVETSLSGSEPEFTVTKTASIGAPGPITYTIVVTNTGGTPLTAVTISDPLLPALAPLDLAIGQAVTATGTFPVTQAHLTANGIDAQGLSDGDGDIDNTVTVVATGPNGPLPNQTASATVAVEQWAVPGATGPPDTLGCSDSPATAWTPDFDGAGGQILQVNFAPANFHGTAIEIHETFNAPFLIRIELIDQDGNVQFFDPVYASSAGAGGGTDDPDTTACPGVFRVDFPRTPYAVSGAWIYTDSPGFEQIDAVCLIGVTVP